MTAPAATAGFGAIGGSNALADAAGKSSILAGYNQTNTNYASPSLSGREPGEPLKPTDYTALQAQKMGSNVEMSLVGKQPDPKTPAF